MNTLIPFLHTHLTLANLITTAVLVLVTATFSIWFPRIVMQWDVPGNPLRTRCLMIIAYSARITVLFFGSVLILSSLNIPTASLLASIGFTGLTVGLALRDVLANIIAGMVLLISEPFEKGDTVKVGDATPGRIVSIGIRSTTLSGQDATTIIPNSLFLTSPVTITRKRL